MDFDFKTLEAIGKKIVQVVPAATALAAPFLGPAGVPVALIGAGVKTLGAALGLTDQEATPEKILDVLSTDPEAKLKILQAQNDFALKMRDLERLADAQRMDAALNTLQTYIADGQDARKRQTEHEKVTGKSDINLYVLAWVVVGGFLGLTAFLILCAYYSKPIADQSGVLYMLLGTLSTAFGMVMGYFFGKNKDSEAHMRTASSSIHMDDVQKLMECASPPKK